MIRQEFIEDVQKELDRAVSLHGGFASEAEGLAVIYEEFIEFRNEVFKRSIDKTNCKIELVQLAAMLAKFYDLFLLKKEND